MRSPAWIARASLAITLMAAAAGSAQAQMACDPCSAGVVFDGPSERSDLLWAGFEEETTDLASPQIAFSMLNATSSRVIANDPMPRIADFCREGETTIPVTLRSALASRADVAKLDSLNVYAQGTGAAAPLLQVADASVGWEPPIIHRRRGLKTVTVSSEIAPGTHVSDVVARLRPWLEAERARWPRGYRYEFGGEE